LIVEDLKVPDDLREHLSILSTLPKKELIDRSIELLADQLHKITAGYTIKKILSELLNLNIPQKLNLETVSFSDADDHIYIVD